MIVVYEESIPATEVVVGMLHEELRELVEYHLLHFFIIDFDLACSFILGPLFSFREMCLGVGLLRCLCGSVDVSWALLSLQQSDLQLLLLLAILLVHVILLQLESLLSLRQVRLQLVLHRRQVLVRLLLLCLFIIFFIIF